MYTSAARLGRSPRYTCRQAGRQAGARRQRGQAVGRRARAAVQPHRRGCGLRMCDPETTCIGIPTYHMCVWATCVGGRSDARAMLPYARTLCSDCKCNPLRPLPPPWCIHAHRRTSGGRKGSRLWRLRPTSFRTVRPFLPRHTALQPAARAGRWGVCVQELAQEVQRQHPAEVEQAGPPLTTAYPPR